MNHNIIATAESIKAIIYTIRGKKVLLDKDLASLYQVEVRALNQAVKRNIKRFPEDFMFQLTKDEWDILKSQFVISSWGGTRKLPYAFTEQGLAMLSGLLSSDIAIQVNINIMRAFVQMREQLNHLSETNLQIEQLHTEIKQLRVDMQNILIEQNDILADQNDINEDLRKQQDEIASQLDTLNDALAQLQAEKNQKDLNAQRPRIGFVTDK